MSAQLKTLRDLEKTFTEYSMSVWGVYAIKLKEKKKMKRCK